MGFTPDGITQRVMYGLVVGDTVLLVICDKVGVCEEVAACDEYSTPDEGFKDGIGWEDSEDCVGRKLGDVRKGIGDTVIE